MRWIIFIYFLEVINPLNFWGKPNLGKMDFHFNMQSWIRFVDICTQFLYVFWIGQALETLWWIKWIWTSYSWFLWSETSWIIRFGINLITDFQGGKPYYVTYTSWLVSYRSSKYFNYWEKIYTRLYDLTWLEGVTSWFTEPQFLFVKLGRG